jgi:hypothetical protein
LEDRHFQHMHVNAKPEHTILAGAKFHDSHHVRTPFSAIQHSNPPPALQLSSSTPTLHHSTTPPSYRMTVKL